MHAGNPSAQRILYEVGLLVFFTVVPIPNVLYGPFTTNLAHMKAVVAKESSIPPAPG